MPIYAYRDQVPRIHETAFIHPDAVVIGDVEIGAHCSLWPGVVVRGDVNSIRIGERVNIQDGTILHVSRPTADNPAGHPLVIGNGVNIGHHVTLHACTVEDECMIGIGAIVLDGAVIRRGAMLAAGSLVPPGKTVAAGELWMGNPARSVRPLTDAERERFRTINEGYAALGREHSVVPLSR